MAHKLYTIKEKKLTRLKKTCPRCGGGYYMADHADRYSCGKCGYSEFKKDPKKEGNAGEKLPPKGGATPENGD